MSGEANFHPELEPQALATVRRLGWFGWAIGLALLLAVALCAAPAQAVRTCAPVLASTYDTPAGTYYVLDQAAYDTLQTVLVELEAGRCSLPREKKKGKQT